MVIKVKRTNWPLRIVIVLASLLIVAGLTITVPALAQDYSFSIPTEDVIATMNDDGTVDLEYTITFSNANNAHEIDIIDIGLPNEDYLTSNMAAQLDGVEVSDIRTSEYVRPGVEIHLSNPIPAGGNGTLHFVATSLPNMFHKTAVDGMTDYASIAFTPNFFSSEFVHGDTDLTVNIVLPAGIQTDEPRYHTPSSNWPGANDPEIRSTPDGRAVYTWHATNAKASKAYEFGASIPASYIPASVLEVGTTSGEPAATGSNDSGNISTWLSVLICLFPVMFIAFIIGIVWATIRGYLNRRMQYLPPKISVVGHGIKRGLTAVEAAILMEQPLDKVMSMILFGVLKKGAAEVTSREPDVKLKLSDPLPDSLLPYEQDFLSAYATENTNERRKLLQDTIVSIVKNVGEKMKGFSKKETIEYYQSIMERAWQQVKAADTPVINSSAYEEVMEWTMLDKDWDKRTKETFSGQTVFLPNWWWRFDPGTPQTSSSGGQSVGVPGSSSMPRPSGAPSSSSMPRPSLPGAEFAASMVTGAQTFATDAIGNLTSFTSSITGKTNPIPTPPKGSGGKGGWGGGGGFSSGHSSCACACACAGCACACAGGGR